MLKLKQQFISRNFSTFIMNLKQWLVLCHNLFIWSWVLTSLNFKYALFTKNFITYVILNRTMKKPRCDSLRQFFKELLSKIKPKTKFSENFPFFINCQWNKKKELILYAPSKNDKKTGQNFMHLIQTVYINQLISNLQTTNIIQIINK